MFIVVRVSAEKAHAHVGMAALILRKECSKRCSLSVLGRLSDQHDRPIKIRRRKDLLGRMGLAEKNIR